MTRSHKHKHNTTSAGPQHQRHADQDCEASTPEEVSYAPPPGPPPPPEASTSSTDTVELHPQATQASFFRLLSSSPQRDEDAADPVEQHSVHFVNIRDSSETHSEADLPISQHAAAGTESPCGNSSQSDSLQQSLPRIAVHASAVSDLPASTPHQSFTISAGPRAQKLYYLWSPKHKQPDAAVASASYIESFDDGKRKLLKQGSSPFADVTKQQVARMATWAPDPADSKHSRKHLRPWWMRLLSPWQKPRKQDGEASGDDDSPDAEPAMPSWRWKLVVFLCCLVAMICYVDRAAMSVAIIPMSLQYGWSNSVKGAINRCALPVSSCP